MSRKKRGDGAHDPLRIALIMNFAPRKLGSLEDWLVGFARGARSRGCEVTLFAREPVHPAVFEALRLARVTLRPYASLQRRPTRAILRLRAFDVVHLNFVAPRSRLAGLAYLAWPSRVLLVDHQSRERELIVPASAQQVETLGMAFKRRVGSPILRARLHEVAAVSDYVRAFTVRELGLPLQRVRTIHNGVRVARFTTVRPPRAVSEPLIIVTVGRLMPVKGVEYAIRALALQDQRVRLRVAGDGADQPRLEGLTRELGVSGRVEFCGLRDDVEVLLGDADVFAHPCVWGEAFGLTIAEAMASGLPVVASRVGGIPELVVDGESGLLVPPGDTAALATAIGRLVADPALRRRLGEAARRRVVRYFSLERWVEAHLDWCQQAAARSSPGA